MHLQSGSAPDPAGGAYSAPRLLAGFEGPLSGEGKERGKGKGRIESREKGEGNWR